MCGCVCGRSFSPYSGRLSSSFCTCLRRVFCALSVIVVLVLCQSLVVDGCSLCSRSCEPGTPPERRTSVPVVRPPHAGFLRTAGAGKCHQGMLLLLSSLSSSSSSSFFIPCPVRRDSVLTCAPKSRKHDLIKYCVSSNSLQPVSYMLTLRCPQK